MSKVILQVGSAVVGLALLAGATGTLLASDRAAGPVKNSSCHYADGRCTYTNGAYWSDCVTWLNEQWYSTTIITNYCTTYNEP